MTYKSERDIFLVYQGKQVALDHHALTVESYIKWYNIYVVSPDGEVSHLPDHLRDDYEKETDEMSWSDHVPNPKFCEWLEVKNPNYEWDHPSLDMIYGRWYRERTYLS